MASTWRRWTVYGAIAGVVIAFAALFWPSGMPGPDIVWHVPGDTEACKTPGQEWIGGLIVDKFEVAIGRAEVLVRYEPTGLREKLREAMGRTPGGAKYVRVAYVITGNTRPVGTRTFYELRKGR